MKMMNFLYHRLLYSSRKMNQNWFFIYRSISLQFQRILKNKKNKEKEVLKLFRKP